jgi:prepilin-type N-terminal cleavage/methylation domain-containing protein
MKPATRIGARSPTAKLAGFTLLETMVALSIFAALGYSLAIVVGFGNHSQRAVSRMAAEDRALRTATIALLDDLRSTTDSSITITPLADGNHQVRFMLPIDVAGVASWGVYDRTLGPDAASQNQPNWHVQYIVRDLALGGGQVNKQLVRQILDDTNTMRKEKVLADGLQSGTQVPPGFKVVKTGLVWQVTLSTVGKVEGKAGIREVFHVRTRN